MNAATRQSNARTARFAMWSSQTTPLSLTLPLNHDTSLQSVAASNTLSRQIAPNVVFSLHPPSSILAQSPPQSSQSKLVQASRGVKIMCANNNRLKITCQNPFKSKTLPPQPCLHPAGLWA